MNQEIIQFINACRAEGLEFDSIRAKLLSAGWTEEITDFHVKYVMEGRTAEQSKAATIIEEKEAGAGEKKRLGPSCSLLVIGWIILVAISLLTEGLVSELMTLLAFLLFSSWILFMNGAARLEGSWLIAIMTLGIGTRWKEGGIRIFAWGNAVIGIIKFIVFMATQGE